MSTFRLFSLNCIRHGRGFKDCGEKYSVRKLDNDDAVCRTALATPIMVNILCLSEEVCPPRFKQILPDARADRQRFLLDINPSKLNLTVGWGKRNKYRTPNMI